MAWSAPKTWAVGDLATSSDQNQYVRDNTKALRTSIDLVTTTAPVTITATTEGTAQTVFTGTTLTYDTNPVYIETFFPSCSGNGTIALTCFRGATNIGHSNAFAPAAGTNGYAADLDFYDATPPGGSYAYVIKGWITATATSITLSAGAGGAGNFGTGWMRVSSAQTT